MDETIEATMCSDCSEPLNPETRVQATHGIVCESCWDDNYFSCTDCGRAVLCDDSYSTQNGVACKRCYERNCTTCERCSEVIRVNEAERTLDGNHVCEYCLCDHYSYCDDCEGYYDDNYLNDHSHDPCDCEASHQTFRIRNDGKAPLRNDTTERVSLPSGVIDDEGMSKICKLIHANVSPAASDSVRVVGSTWQTRDGNFTKRLSRTIWKTTQQKVSPAVLSEVGNIARDHSVAVDFDVEVTRNLNLPASEFAHDGSCWWGDYYTSRCALKSNGGFGLRTFDRFCNVTGRAWVLPLVEIDGEMHPTLDAENAHAYVVFNGYESLSGYAATRVLSHMVGFTYRKIDFTASPMYVNDDNGYLVAPEELAERFTDGELHLYLDQHANLTTPVVLDLDKELVNA